VDAPRTRPRCADEVDPGGGAPACFVFDFDFLIFSYSDILIPLLSNNFQVSEDALISDIKNTKIFHTEKKFNPERYQKLLESKGIKISEYEKIRKSKSNTNQAGAPPPGSTSSAHRGLVLGASTLRLPSHPCAAG
jgi:hypothetical protein